MNPVKHPLELQREAFDKEHGGNPVYVPEGYWLYADGAYVGNTPYGPYVVPRDSDTAGRAELVRRYHELRLAEAVRAFDQAKAQMLAVQPHRDYATKDADVAKLQELRAVVVERRAAFAAADIAWQRARGTYRTPEQIAAEARAAEARELQKTEYLEAVQAVQV